MAGRLYELEETVKLRHGQIYIFAPGRSPVCKGSGNQFVEAEPIWESEQGQEAYQEDVDSAEL